MHFSPSAQPCISKNTALTQRSFLFIIIIIIVIHFHLLSEWNKISLKQKWTLSWRVGGYRTRPKTQASWTPTMVLCYWRSIHSPLLKRRKRPFLTGHSSSHNLPTVPTITPTSAEHATTYLTLVYSICLVFLSPPPLPPSFLISSLQGIQVWRCGKHLCWIRHYSAFLRTTKVEAQFKWKKGLVVLLHSEFYTEDPLQGWPQHHFFFRRICIADQAGSQNITLPYSCHAFKEIF